MKTLLFLVTGLVAAVATAAAGETLPRPEDLRLVPFPKQLVMAEGGFALDHAGPVVITGAAAEAAGALIRDELLVARLRPPALQTLPGDARASLRWGVTEGGLPPPSVPEPAKAEGYALSIAPGGLAISAETGAGLLNGVRTLCQLIRANRTGNRLPCLAIADWPSLRWRCFQDDLTRGPSTRLEVLKRQLELGAFLKHNLFTYYMEHQYAWSKHPVIGPADGSLTPAELQALVSHGQPLHVDILGNQQSFGHFGHILKHEQYAGLRETPNVLSPVREESYGLLDDLYREVVPLLPLPFFNVCCDETWGLGEGPSRELAREIGVGGVYAGHLRRIHDLLKDKYGKRMMMWGDIILQHPDHLREIPKDTILLTWGYGPRASFEDQILPFAQSGYEFFVCPGVNNWNRILPDFDASLTNIRNFVRDGAKHGALGMLNTAWDDDGENLNAPSWHGYAWGAECAWNASATEPRDFNRRIGAVLFGERGDRFGQAIELLARTHGLHGSGGMGHARFWQLDLETQQTTAALAQALLDLVQPALAHLAACRAEAVTNAGLLDAFLHGARRMELVGRRILDTRAAAGAYQAACELPPGQAAPRVREAADLLRKLRDSHEALGNEFAELWRRENKPHALDAVLNRYAGATARYDAILGRLESARAGLAEGQPLPSAREIGLEFIEPGRRSTRPDRVVRSPLEPGAPWLEPRASHRLSLAIDAGPVERVELPIEVDVSLPTELASKPVRAFRLLAGGGTLEIPAQVDPAGPRLILFLRESLAKGSCARVVAYLGLPDPAQAPAPGGLRTAEAENGGKWLENDQVRLLLGPEGAHLYRWEVKALGGRDLTMPGETSWLGFADLGGERRSARNALVCTASGPALIRYRCTDETGTEKTISLYAGVTWVEILLNDAPSYFWAFDDPENFAADGPSPGQYRFSTGAAGNVGSRSQGVSGQVKANGALWSVKLRPDNLALGLVTPGAPARHAIAPGAGAGGVGIEGSSGAHHFILFGGIVEGDAAARMARYAGALNLRQRPSVTVHAVQRQPGKASP